jgi:hypothetical protein
MVFTLRLCVLRGLLPCAALIDRVCITEVESVYCAVQTGALYRVIPSVLDPRKCEYLKDYSLDFE